jgi:peptidylprolyl isomerase
MKRLVSIIAVASLLVFTFAAVALAVNKPDSTKAAAADVTKKDATKAVVATGKAKVEKHDTVTTASGLKYIDIKVGNGAVPKAGQIIEAHYTGWLTDGTMFQSSKDRGVPLSFPLGQGKVIKGWDEGFSTMKVGGVRKLIIAPALAYGASGRPPVIPANATLIFEVELLSVK